MSRDMEQIIDSARDDLKEQIEGGYNADDAIHEIADQHVPVYNADLIDAFRSDSSLWNRESEIGHGTAGNNVIGHMQAVVYEAIAEALREDLDEIRKEVAAEALAEKLLPVGTRIRSTEEDEAREGEIEDTDPHDPDYPYLVRWGGGKEEWMGEDEIERVEA